VELGSVYVFAGYGGSEGLCVFGLGADYLLVSGLWVERMNEVNVGAVCDAIKQLVLFDFLDGVPAHMRNLHLAR
jgi:hypothetical protein